MRSYATTGGLSDELAYRPTCLLEPFVNNLVPHTGGLSDFSRPHGLTELYAITMSSPPISMPYTGGLTVIS